METGKKRAVLVWHRRSGKDKTALNFTIRSMFPQFPGGRVGTYYHLFPTYAQGKKILWDGIDGSGRPYMDHFPKSLIVGKPNETELQIKLRVTPGRYSYWQIIGTDKIDSIVGTNPIGCVFSEYALQNPKAWNLLRPILRENGGWAIFDYTPRGHNHGKRLFEMAMGNEDWFCEKLTVNDTFRDDGRPVITPEDIEAERREGMDEELIQQEYYCSFEGWQQGSYYGRIINRLETDGRIGVYPWIPELPVHTFWDLGISDSMVIWFAQRVGKERRFIDFYENSGEGIAHYAKELAGKPYKYGRHLWPHDGTVRDFNATKRRDVAEGLGIKPIDIVPRGKSLSDGIEVTRNFLNGCTFDRVKCKQGLDALGAYHKEWDEDRKEFKAVPVHDWSSHPADAFRTAAHAGIDRLGQNVLSRLRIETEFDPHNQQDVIVVSDFDV